MLLAVAANLLHRIFERDGSGLWVEQYTLV